MNTQWIELAFLAAVLENILRRYLESKNAHESNNQLPLTPIQRNLEIVVAENDLGELHFPFSAPSRLMNSPTYHKLIDRR